MISGLDLVLITAIALFDFVSPRYRVFIRERSFPRLG